jgi:hypothetical protein
MKKKYILILILQVIFVLILSCKNRNNEIIEGDNVRNNEIIEGDNVRNNEIIEVESVYVKEVTELYNLFINKSLTEIDSSEEYIIKNKPYKIKQWPYHILIFENEKCYDGEEWHEVMISFGGGIIIFGEKMTILSEEYHYIARIGHYLTIIDENGNLIMDNKIIGNNTKIKIIQDKVEIQFYNSKNELVKYLLEIEDL